MKAAEQNCKKKEKKISTTKIVLNMHLDAVLSPSIISKLSFSVRTYLNGDQKKKSPFETHSNHLKNEKKKLWYCEYQKSTVPLGTAIHSILFLSWIENDHLLFYSWTQSHTQVLREMLKFKILPSFGYIYPIDFGFRESSSSIHWNENNWYNSHKSSVQHALRFNWLSIVNILYVRDCVDTSLGHVNAHWWCAQTDMQR